MKLFSAGLDNMLRRSDKIQARPVYMWGCFLTKEKKAGRQKFTPATFPPWLWNPSGLLTKSLHIVKIHW